MDDMDLEEYKSSLEKVITSLENEISSLNEVKQYKDKPELISSWLNKGMIQVMVDTTIPGVVVPSIHHGKTSLLLNLSHTFRGMPEMKLKEDAIYATLSFHGVIFDCVLPWDSIWMMRQGEHELVFPSNVPKDEHWSETIKHFLLNPTPKAPERKVKPQKPSFLQTINGGGEVSAPRTGHLKLLKD